jgi:hypothetical protein
MEQRGVWLRGIARVLNAGGSALLNFYDAATSMKIVVLPGEKGSLRAQIGEYEKKIGRLYHEIGSEVVLREDKAHLSEAGEAGIRRVAEYQAEIEKIKQRIQEIEAAEKAAAAARKEAAKECCTARVKTASEPLTEVKEYAMTETPEEISVSTEEPDAVTAEPVTAEESIDDKPEEVKDVKVEAAETPVPEMAADTVESAEPEDGAVAVDVEVTEAATTEVLETMLKDDLLKLCKERGIEADKRMTKAGIIELMVRRP